MSRGNTPTNERKLFDALLKGATLSATVQTYPLDDQKSTGVLMVSKLNEIEGLLIEQEKATGKVGIFLVELDYNKERKTYGYKSLVGIEEEFDNKSDLLSSPLDLFTYMTIELLKLQSEAK